MRTIIVAAVLAICLAPALACAQAVLPGSGDPPKSQKPDTPGWFKDPQKTPNPADILKEDKDKEKDPKKIKPAGPSLGTKIYGKTITQWIEQISSKDPSKAQVAIQNVLLFGPDLAQLAAPTLNKLLENYWGLDLSVKANAVVALGMILDEENNPSPTQVKAAVKTMTTILKFETQPTTKLKAIEALAVIGPAALDALPQLKDLAADKLSWEMREAACYALGRIGYDKKNGPNIDAIHALYGRLAIDNAFQVRLAAIQSLTYLGPPKIAAHRKAVYDALADVGLKDSEPTVKIWSRMALMSLEGKADLDSVKLIAAMLEDKDVAVRVQAAQSLAALGMEAKGEVKLLVAALDDPEKIVAAWAVMALSRMEKHAAPAESHLKKIVANKEWPPSLKETAQKTLDILSGKTAVQGTSTVGKDQDKNPPKMP